MAQLAKDLLSLKSISRDNSMIYPLGLRNHAWVIGRAMAQHMCPSSMRHKLAELADHIMDSIHDILDNDPEEMSNRGSTFRSNHPSYECFMADLKSVSNEDGTSRTCERAEDDESSL